MCASYSRQSALSALTRLASAVTHPAARRSGGSPAAGRAARVLALQRPLGLGRAAPRAAAAELRGRLRQLVRMGRAARVAAGVRPRVPAAAALLLRPGGRIPRRLLAPVGTGGRAVGMRPVPGATA